MVLISSELVTGTRLQKVNPSQSSHGNTALLQVYQREDRMPSFLVCFLEISPDDPMRLL